MDNELESLALNFDEDDISFTMGPDGDDSFAMAELYSEMSAGNVDYDMLYKESFKPTLEVPDNFMDDGGEGTSGVGTSVNFDAFPQLLIGDHLSLLENDDEGQFKTVDNDLDSPIIKDSFWSSPHNYDDLSVRRPEFPSEMSYYGISDHVLGLDPGLEQALSPENKCHESSVWNNDYNTALINDSPTKILASTNSRSLLRSNVSTEDTLPATFEHIAYAPSPVKISRKRYRSSDILYTYDGNPGVPYHALIDLPDPNSISSGDESSDSDAVETNVDSIWGGNDRTMMVANDLMTPENSDVDTKIRYTSHDHTYSHPTQDKIQTLNKNGSYLTPSETDDSEIDVESLSTDHLAKTWRQQLDESRQPQQGYRRTAVRTLMPVNKNLKKPKIEISYEVNKLPANSKNKNSTRPTPKRPARSKRADNLTAEQQETRRLRHNAAERQRRHIQRDLLQELNGAVPTTYMPKGRMSQQNVMKGAAECLKDFKLQHDQVGFEFAQTTIFDELHDISQIIRRLCNAASH